MKHNHGASGRGPNAGAANLAMLKRTVKKIFSYYPVLAPITLACILFSSVVSSIPALFTQNVIQVIEKWYVSRDWAAAQAELTPILTLLIVLYALSILAILVQKQLMAYMTQGFLNKLRQEMFGGMQDLPIRYFDTHQHGDIMSFYTNDIDTLRQLVSEAIPAFLQSGAIVLAVFAIMLYFSLWLTLVLILGIVLMISVTKRVGGGSAKFFLRQQKAVAKTEGFIQETMTGQKVVKVFCHEQRSIEEFDKINDALFEDSYRAHAYASVLGPIIGNIGNFLYVALALVGGVLLLIGVPNLSLSGKALDISILVPFLNMTKQFTGNINQLSQQINSIVMAGAGAQRVFSLIDEKTETDDGFVTLVDANIAPDGTITESDHHTGHWAWKNPNDNGKASYRELRGDVRLIDVDFGYEPNKEVLHDVSVYAEPGQKVAFVGATGAGKTTITNLINRFYDIQGGQITYDGIPISTLGQRYRDIFGYLPQEFGFYPEFTVQDYLEYIAVLKGLTETDSKRKIGELLEQLTLTHVRRKKIAKLSGGMKRRVGIAQALLNEPEVLILDEPTSGLDPGERVRFRNLLSEFAHDRIVLISTHIVSDVEYIATRNAVMKGGKLLACGTTEELVKLVEGKVWTATIPASALGEYERRLPIVNLRNEESGEISIRYLAEEPSVSNSAVVAPRLEDLYLWLFPQERR